MKDNNVIILIGNVGGDLEMRFFESGKKLLKFFLVVIDNYKDKVGEW